MKDIKIRTGSIASLMADIFVPLSLYFSEETESHQISSDLFSCCYTVPGTVGMTGNTELGLLLDFSNTKNNCKPSTTCHIG